MVIRGVGGAEGSCARSGLWGSMAEQSTGPGALEGAGGPEGGPDLQGVWAPGWPEHPRRPQASRRPRAPDVRPCRVARALRGHSCLHSPTHSFLHSLTLHPLRQCDFLAGGSGWTHVSVSLRPQFCGAGTVTLPLHACGRRGQQASAPLRPGRWIRSEDASADPGGTGKRVMTFKSQDVSSASLRAKLPPSRRGAKAWREASGVCVCC